MDNQVDSSKKKDKLKVIKDLSFLHQIIPNFVNDHCVKYLLQEGEGDPLHELQENFQIVYSLKQYDYEGKRMNQYAEGKLPKFGKTNDLTPLLLTMKIKQKAWFNVCHEVIFNQAKNGEEFDEMEVIQGESLQDEPMTESVPEDEEDHPERTGWHYQLYVIKIQYKNKQDMQTKRKIFAQKKQEARGKFSAKEYLEAAKIYKFLDSITTGYSKKIFSFENTIELDSMNQNSKVNYLKCYFKILESNADIPEDINTHAVTAIQSLLKNTNNDPVVHFLNAKWLLKERYLDQSFKEAQLSYKIKPTPEAYQLMLLIKQQKENKGKIKVAVREPQKK